MNIFRRFVTWWDANILLVLSAFLLAFIPLYPKIPLWSPIEQYIVRVRLEDLFILLTAVIYGIQWIRQKVRWRSVLLWPILAYAVVGILSTASGIWITHTIPFQPLHVGKSLLHYFRYLEYFSMFFILFAAVRKRRDVWLVISIFALTILAITGYGYMQKYFYWPVYSTMNREFSKGVRLYLTQYARVQSTFGGHYDMAAYLVVMLPLILAFAMQLTKRWMKIALMVIFWGGTWLIILSASRTPFVAYLAGVGIVLLVTSLLKKTWTEKMTYFVTRSAVTFAAIMLVFFYFGDDLSDRLNALVRNNQKVADIVNVITEQRRHFISDEQLAQSPLAPKNLQALLPKGQPPEGAISTDDAAAAAAAAQATQIASISDLPPMPFQKPKASPSPSPTAQIGGPDLPADVKVIVPDEVTVSTVSASGEVITTTQKRPRIYSECALKSELSWCIRQETLWPRAIEGFLTNPLVGSGYATLTKENIDQFTEADSTDNNFLRTLGETGALGFLTFYGVIAIVLIIASRHLNDSDDLKRMFSLGMFAGSISLLLNAVYIDVYASSKVAQTYWALTGVFLAMFALDMEIGFEEHLFAIPHSWKNLVRIQTDQRNAAGLAKHLIKKTEAKMPSSIKALSGVNPGQIESVRKHKKTRVK
jgi:hypothetical protein